MPEHAAGRVSARPPARALEWVMGVMGPGSRIGSVRYLAGTSFHANHAIEVLDARGAPREVVLRRWAGAGWELTDAEFDAEREADILRLLEASLVPAPRLIADDPNAVGCDVPALLVTLLPGQPVDHPAELPGFLRELASVVAAIHAIDGRAAAIVPPYRRYCDPATLGVPGWAARPGLWKRAIEIARQPAPSGRECLIHRDLHPGNMLWSGGRVTGVVDWSYGSWGPAAVDTAHLRWNLAVDFGAAGADDLLSAGVPLDHHPYWDLVDVLDLVGLPGDDMQDELMGTRLEAYVASVLARL